MNYIFYYFGKIPDYVEYSINSVLNADPRSRIFICSDEKVNFENVVHINPLLVESKNTKFVKKLNYFEDGDQNPLWSSSMMRIFYINDVANYFKLDSYVHFDSDVLIFKSFTDLSHLFKKNKFNITPLMKEFLVFGYSFIENRFIFSEIVEIISDILSNSRKYEEEFYSGNRLNEMKALYIASVINPKLFNLLPVLPDKDLVFDPGSYGQYLGGVHYKKFSKNYVNPEHIVGNSLINKEIYIENKGRAPKVIKDEKSYDIVNLHVHKKNLKKFQPKDYIWKTR
ncbi:MAG: hypothetical protein CMC23_00415 [Flavobacteriaceae bacterium]|nr:hypothetical protein [Flavobacteriaceae bacterium]|tara:strand:+ start:1 stop:849 length:849 start_codon:yes stop_codon:yes gene_type:complete